LNNTSTYNTERCGDFKVDINSPNHKPSNKPMPIYETCIYLLTSDKDPIIAEISLNYTASEEVYLSFLPQNEEETLVYNNSRRNLDDNYSQVTNKTFTSRNSKELVIAFREKEYVDSSQFAFSLTFLKDEETIKEDIIVKLAILFIVAIPLFCIFYCIIACW
jgi:hypothetical protein